MSLRGSSDAQIALEYAIAFLVFTFLAIFIWVRFISSSTPNQTPAVEKYIERMKEGIN